MKKILRIVLIIVAALYIAIGLLLYFNTENLIFAPEKLPKDYPFHFNQKFEELNIVTKNNQVMDGLLFKADSSKGVIFYLHGNAECLKEWGTIAKTYTDLHYDVFMLDYPGYGKSDGKITSQKQLYQDLQTAYDSIKLRYPENKIIVLGYSIGTGLAAGLAATNNPKLLILQAPYFNLADLAHHLYSITRIYPSFLFKYKFATNKFIKKCKMPIVDFHGNKDEIIYYGSSLKLKKEFTNKQDTLITLNGQGHNGITKNPNYLSALKKILAN